MKMFIIEEETIRNAAELVGPESTLYKVLEEGKKIKDTGEIPVYLINQEMDVIYTIPKSKVTLTAPTIH